MDQRTVVSDGEASLLSDDDLPVRVYAQSVWPLEIRYTDQWLDPATVWDAMAGAPMAVTIVVTPLSRAHRLERCLADLRFLLSEEGR